MSQAGINNTSVTVNPAVPTSFTEDVGTAVPVANNLKIVGGVGITTSGSGNTVTITNTGVSSSLNFATDSGTATESGNTITFHGVGGLSFSGSGATVTGTLAAIPNASLANSSITVTAGTGLTGGGTVALGGTITLNSTSTGTVTSVSGTLNRITSTGGATPVIDISASYVGQSSITTLGTIGTGVWQGTVVGSTYGGTGVNNGASTITLGGSLTTSGAFASTFTMTAGTSVTFPTSGTLATTAQLPSITATQFDVLVGGAANAIASVGPGSAGQVLQSGGNAANPVYSTATYPATASGTGTFLRANGTNWVASSSTIPDTFAQGDIIYGSASNVLTALAKDTNSTRVLTNTGTSNNPAWAQVTLTSGVTGTLPVANGGTSLATLTAHALYVGNGTSAPNALAVGTSGQVLIAATTADPAFASLTSTAASITYTTGANSLNLDIANYGTGTWSPTFSLATPGTSSFTYSRQVGRYQRMGNIVWYQFNTLLTNFTVGTGSGNFQVDSFPFTSVNASNQVGGNGLEMAQITGTLLYYQFHVNTNSVNGVINGMTSASSLTTIAAGAISNTTLASSTGFYFTA